MLHVILASSKDQAVTSGFILKKLNAYHKILMGTQCNGK